MFRTGRGLEPSVRTYEEYRSLGRFPALDGLRAVSILLVIAEHSRNHGISEASGGFNGVVLFFVLSGFLITSLSLREEDRYGSVHLRAFAVRRAFRILPIYYAVLLLYIGLVLVLKLDPRAHEFRDALPFYAGFFQEHVRFATHSAAEFAPFEVSWSLGIEEKFYLLWPALAFLLLRRRPQLRVPVAATLALIATLAPFWLGDGGVYLFYYGAILFGCLVALLLHHPRTYLYVSRIGNPRGLALAVGLALTAHGLTYLRLVAGSTIEAVTLALLFPAFAILVTALVTTKSRRATVLDRPLIRRIGEISYAVYLLHLVFLNVVEKAVPESLGLPGDVIALLLGAAAALIACHFVQKYFEAPVTDLGKRLAARVSHRASVHA